MKKTYMIPTIKVVDLGTEDSVLVVESQVDGLSTVLNDEVVETEDYVKENKALWDKMW